MKKTYENSAEYREVPQMTRSEYVDEYGEILEYYKKQRAEEKKLLPVYIIVMVLGLLFIVYGICTKNPVFLFVIFILTAPFNVRNRRYYRRCGLSMKDVAKAASLPFFFLFPIGSYFARLKQIDNAEKKQIQDLEDRKNLCIEIGTYNAEE